MTATKKPTINPKKVTKDFYLDLYLNKVGDYSLLSHADEIRLANRIQDGDISARDELVCANLRLVVAIARRFWGTPNIRQNFALPDLISEGNIGLFTAAKKYDPTRGTRFSTMATWWIMQAIRQYIKPRESVVWIPNYMADLVRQVTRRGLLTDREREAKIASMNLSPKTEKCLRSALHIGVCVGEPNSFREKVYNQPEPLDVLIADEENGRISQALDVLDQRERYVIQHRFGLAGSPARTLEQVGTDLNMTKERVRQLQQRAIKKLKEAIGEEQ